MSGATQSAPTVPPASDWVLATFAGWALGFLLMLVFIVIAGVLGFGETQFAVGLGMGAGVGFMQARVLREWFPRLRNWLLASAIGVAAPFAVSDVSGLLRPDLPYSLPLLVVAGGLTAGVLQWRMLRACSRRAAWWIPASVAGWSLAASTAVFNQSVLPRIPGIVGALLYIAVVMVGGILLGGIGALVLPRILARTSPITPGQNVIKAEPER